MKRAFEIAKISFQGVELLQFFISHDGVPDDNVIMDIERRTYPENNSLSFWLFMSKRSQKSLFVDVGAYSGIYALFSARSNFSNKVIAFEPSSITFGRLTHNIKINSLDTKIIPARVAVSNSKGEIIFSHRYGFYTLCSGETLLANPESSDHTEKVSTITLDEIISESKDIDFLNSKSISYTPFDNIACIKVDVEHHELEVLKGCSKIIQQYQPCFICEALTREEADRLIYFFADFHYLPLEFDGERNIVFIPSYNFENLIKEFRSYHKNHNEEINVRRLLTYPLSDLEEKCLIRKILLRRSW